MIDAPTDSASEGRERLEELYARHLPEAQRLAYLLVGNSHLAEDIAQEAFVRLASRFRHLRNPDAFGAYLRRTVVNLCRGHFRRSRVERSYLQTATDPDPAPAADAHVVPDLVAAVRDLPDRQRAAVVLRYYEDLSESETAEILRCSRKSVNGLVARAMETLRRRVGNEER